MCKRKGLTGLELCVVIAIIGILIAMLVLAVNKVREAAERVQAQHTEEKQPKDASPEKPFFPGGVGDAPFTSEYFLFWVVFIVLFWFAIKHADKKKEEEENST